MSGFQPERTLYQIDLSNFVRNATLRMDFDIFVVHEISTTHALLCTSETGCAEVPQSFLGMNKPSSVDRVNSANSLTAVLRARTKQLPNRSDRLGEAVSLGTGKRRSSDPVNFFGRLHQPSKFSRVHISSQRPISI